MILEVKNLTFGYHNGNNILNNISFDCDKGDAVAILGRNGVGKSTLLKLILKMYNPISGNLFLNGKNYNSLNKKELFKTISFVPQHSNIYLNYTVFDSVLIGLSKYIDAFNTPTDDDCEKVNKIMDKFSITHLKDKYLYEISGGELQLSLIARALISEPEIIIMDEPETGLDVKNQILILKMLKNIIQEGKTVIFNTHYIEHAINFSNKCILLRKNSFIFGNTNDVINKENIKTTFDVDIDVDNTHNNENKYILLKYN